MKKMSLDEWQAEGTRRFGNSMKDWKFVCPRCKTVQTAQDLLDAGVEKDKVESYIAFSCIGRFTKDKGCNWTLGGLFQIHTLEVTTSGGARPTFEFAEE